MVAFAVSHDIVLVTLDVKDSTDFEFLHFIQQLSGPKPRITYGKSSKLNSLLFHIYSKNLPRLRILVSASRIYSIREGSLHLLSFTQDLGAKLPLTPLQGNPSFLGNPSPHYIITTR
uniref:Uncharacterized protein n=1 Tax=Micrurus lemniscatus lemniscatus TaxID=129467 RepID=A0A2D4ILF3_MICLE